MTPFEIQNLLQRFAGLDSETVLLKRGEILFLQGDPGDCLYIVRRGRLRAIYDWKGPNERVLGEIARGEPVGEIALVSRGRRSASIVATRDTELARISLATFENLTETHPREVIGLMRIIASRLKNDYETGRRESLPASIVVIPANAASPLRDYCENLDKTLDAGGWPSEHLSSRNIPENLREPFQFEGIASWLDDAETRVATVLLEADPTLTDWTRLCLSHADLVVVLGVARTDPTPGEIERLLRCHENDPVQPRVDLVLLHQHGAAITDTAAWLAPRDITRHHHIRDDFDIDRDRALRLLTGTDISLILGGGGARGFAHIGIYRALVESGIPVDRVGGTSMGAIIGACIARGMDWKDIAREVRHQFTERGRLTSFTLPVVSIDTARGYQRMLDRLYGDTCIEDLPINFFCVSANLTRAKVIVHRDGRLSKWIGASMSVPGVAPPLVVNGEMHVDGGVLNNLPIDISRADGAGKVIAVDVSPEVEMALAPAYNGRPSAWEALRSRFGNRKGDNAGSPSIPGLFSILSRVSTLSSITAKEQHKLQADLFIKVPVSGFKMFAWDRVDELIELGYRVGMKSIENWTRKGGANSSLDPDE
jgi:NTE family protein